MKHIANEKILPLEDRLVQCVYCQGKMSYFAGGQYKCEECGNIEYDDFGKVKHFLEEYGTAPATLISHATGVKESVIQDFLDDGRIQVALESKYKLECKHCGRKIRYGRYCADCINKTMDEITSQIEYEKSISVDRIMRGKMHFRTDRK